MPQFRFSFLSLVAVGLLSSNVVAQGTAALPHSVSAVVAAPIGDRSEPFGSTKFLVEIDGVTVSGFDSVSGLENETDVVEYREGNEVGQMRKLPGLHRYANIVLKRGFSGSKELWKWRKEVLDGNTQRRSGSIVILDEAREEVARFNFRGAWPKRWKVSALNSAKSGVLTEEIEIVVEALELAN